MMPMQKNGPSISGFTLIELLIVVAMIAILAAISVPNYLEAQNRAKISRARADLRSITTALETYRVDQNKYPTMIDPAFDGGVAPLAGSQIKWWYVPDSLSTPIAYMTSADTRCPFGGDVARRDDFSGDIWRRYSYENIAELYQKAKVFPVLAYKYSNEQDPIGRIGQWRILCIGPNHSWNPMVQYDPSNGSTSDGNIMRTQNDPTGLGSEQIVVPSY